jgi:hypothetical protein
MKPARAPSRARVAAFDESLTPHGELAFMTHINSDADAHSETRIDTSPNTGKSQARAVPPDKYQETLNLLMAESVMSPEFSSAIVVQAYNQGSNLDQLALMEQLQAQHTRLAAGNQAQAENMLMSQAVALQAIFAKLALRALTTTGDSQFQIVLGLAFRAQSGCRATLQTLGELKNPRQATFVKQANIAQGPQQVNNGAATAPSSPTTRAQEEVPDSTNKLSGAKHELLEDTRAAGPAIPGYPVMATMGKVHRAKVRRG